MKLGFIGLGNMGTGMVTNLLKSHHEVLVYDIDGEKIKLLKTSGATPSTLSDIKLAVELVILCLPHPSISNTVIDELIDSDNTVKTIIDTSTITPEDTQTQYKKLKAKDIKFLCAPMLGGKNAANNKTIHFLIEGNKDTFERYKELFLEMGMRADYMGTPPSATLAKLAYNICRYSNIATASEVSRFLRSYTQDTTSIYNLLTEGSLDNFGQVWKEDIREMVLEGKPYTPSAIPEKDLTLIIDLAKKQNLSDKFYNAIKDVYRSLIK